MTVKSSNRLKSMLKTATAVLLSLGSSEKTGGCYCDWRLCVHQCIMYRMLLWLCDLKKMTFYLHTSLNANSDRTDDSYGQQCGLKNGTLFTCEGNINHRY